MNLSYRTHTENIEKHTILFALSCLRKCKPCSRQAQQRGTKGHFAERRIIFFSGIQNSGINDLFTPWF